ncbi:uncharacterized protein BROUX77_003900 [Berkeleyomyces rouxiae]|uniref:uncharacterized protein n=1 Tax=Berkeleyomyces rouxiae TaxID=2035830 RepID=UPI003B7D100F
MYRFSPWPAILAIFLSIIISTTDFGHNLSSKITETFALYRDSPTDFTTTAFTASSGSSCLVLATNPKFGFLLVIIAELCLLLQIWVEETTTCPLA